MRMVKKRTEGKPVIEKLDGWFSAAQAAEHLGYHYITVINKLEANQIPRAGLWQGIWVIPDDITEEEILTPPPGRPRKENLPWEHEKLTKPLPKERPW